MRYALYAGDELIWGGLSLEVALAEKRIRDANGTEKVATTVRPMK